MGDDQMPIAEHANNRKGVFNTFCRNGHRKGRGPCPTCKKKWQDAKRAAAREAKEPQCRNGHPKTGPGKCVVCGRLHDIRRTKRERKFRPLTLTAELIQRSEVPEDRYIVDKGFWASIASRLQYLEPDEALMIPLQGFNFQSGVITRHLKTARHTVQGGVLYLWRV